MERIAPVAMVKDRFEKALALHQSGQLAAARGLYAEVLAAEPGHFDSLHLSGLATVQDGDLDAGIALIRRALALRPEVAAAHYNLGHALLTAGEAAAALDSFAAALMLNPADAQCHFEAANALKDLGRNDEAIARYDQAIRLEPRFPEALNNRGIALKDAGRLQDAVASYDRAIALRPRYAEAHSNRGNALKEMGRFAEALACHDTAIGLKPGYAEAHFNRGNALSELKRHEEALASFDAALALRPGYAEARHNKALLLLGLGRHREGFPLYAARWQTANFGSAPFKGGVPRWDGGSGAGHVLLWAEQGIGDEILHASLLPLVPAGLRVTLAVDPRLLAIFRRSFPHMRVIGSEVLKDAIDEGYDAQAPLGDLGALLGVDAERLAAKPAAFLTADAGRRAALRDAPSFPRRGPVAGLSWKSANQKFGAEKSLRLTDLAPILTIPGLSFVNLQYGAVDDDIAEAKAALGVEVRQVEGLDVYNDIDGLMALVDACDVVVTTSNVTAHLAGAIGKKGVVLVPAGKGLLWYWQGGSNNLWYPSLTRAAQPRIGDWQPAIAAAAAWVRDTT
jgi:tetratricopeptide (TPR) repeat protein